MRGKLIIEVVAGIIPQQPMPEHTKLFALTSEEYENPDPKAVHSAWDRVHGEAMMYMLGLMNPKFVNWVRLDWIWL